MGTAQQRELGRLLRANRDRIRPDQAGLRSGGRRRSPGLRREEVAALAGVSVAWYTWLEQGRVAASRQVIEAICAALRVDGDTGRHALSLAGFLPRGPALADEPAAARPATHALLEHWTSTPALLLDQRLDILTGNRAWTRL